MRVKSTALAAVLACVALTLSACGSSSGTGSAHGQTSVCWADPQAKQPIFQTFTDALNAAAKRSNFKVITLDGQANPAQQVSDIQTCITDHVKAIIVYTLHQEAENAVMEKAHAAGIKLIGVNAVPAGYRQTPTVPPPYDANLDLGFVTGAHDAAKYEAQQLGGQGNVVGIKIPIPVSSLVSMLAAYKQYVTEGSPNIHWLAELPDATDDLAGGRSSVADAVTRYNGKINGVLSYTDISAIGAAQALASAGVKNPVIVGLQGNQAGIDAVKSGQIQGDVDTEPYTEAVYALALTKAVLAGTPTAKFVSSPVQFLTKDNVNSYLPWSEGVQRIKDGKTPLTVNLGS